MSNSFVAVDWGTTSFRLWNLSQDGEVLDRSSGPFGMATLSKDEFGTVLEDAMTKLFIDKDVPVVICGMAGAAQGWHEAPYVAAPTALTNLGSGAVRVPDIDRDVRILPGIKQMEPGNVMRGEETQLLGLLQARPDFDGVVCLPGTHSKWVRLRSGQIECFATCMTGEIFSLLSSQSVLKHSMGEGGWDADAFIEAVTRLLADPARLADSLFSLRADKLLADLSSDTARARLSGMLIGIELAATRAYWEGASVALIGESSLCRNYAMALASLSEGVETLDSESMTLGGLVAAAKQMQSNTL